MKQQAALIVIDIQNDYFPGGKFELWGAEATLARTEAAIAAARGAGIPVIHVQHIAGGPAPFFNAGSEGVAIHPRILAAAPDAPIVIKQQADAFLGTRLASLLEEMGCEELLLCGMMTQNCVTHTALSKSAERYRIKVIADCCTTVSEMIHRIALNALAARVAVIGSLVV